MKLLVPIAVTLIAISARPLAAQELPRVVLLSVVSREPSGKAVGDLLKAQLAEIEIGLEVTAVELGRAPLGPSGWLKRAETSRAPGTVAVFGYSCKEKKCSLHIIDPENKSSSRLPVRPRSGTSRTEALAATIREALIGPLLPEMKRLIGEGADPSTPRRSGESPWGEFKNKRGKPKKQNHPWLWTDGGYIGDHAHKEGHPLHGPWIGLAMEPVELLGVMLSVGWLGIRRAEVETAGASVQRLFFSMSLPLILPVGPARISLAPTGRFDVAFADIDNTGRADERLNRFEFQLGGLSVWHLPLSWRLEIFVGAGVLVSVISEETKVSISENQRVTAIPASTLRLTWLMGFAWSPLRPRLEQEEE